MNRLIIDKKGKIEIKNSQLIFNEYKYPLRQIDFLILADDIEISTKTISKLTKENISILIYNKTFSFIHPQNSKNADLKKAQYLSLNKRVDLAKHFISKKITNNFLNIEFNIQKLNEAKSIDEIMGIEGSFAKKYFKEYFTLFPKHYTKGYRSKQPPEDIVNSMMSYLYTIVYYEITNRLLFFGFEPQIGYLHEPFRAHNALSSDILEIFRSEIDKFVYKLFKNNLTKKDFTTNYRLRDEKRKELWTEIKTFLETLKIDKEISYLRGLL